MFLRLPLDSDLHLFNQRLSFECSTSLACKVRSADSPRLKASQGNDLLWLASSPSDASHVMPFSLHLGSHSSLPITVNECHIMSELAWHASLTSPPLPFKSINQRHTSYEATRHLHCFVFLRAACFLLGLHCIRLDSRLRRHLLSSSRSLSSSLRLCNVSSGPTQRRSAHRSDTTTSSA